MKMQSIASWKGTIGRLAGESLDSPAKAAFAVALGVFFGIAPFWGFQLILALLAASYFKVNRILAGAATNVSVPPLIPFIVYTSVKLGGIVLGRSASPAVFIKTGSLQAVKNCALQYLLGSLLLAILCALAAGSLAYAGAAVAGKNSSYKKNP